MPSSIGVGVIGDPALLVDASPQGATATLAVATLSSDEDQTEDYRRLDDGQPTSPSPQLAALLGRKRARILLYLAEPMTAGTVADTLAMVPSAVTHHLTVLEKAGLVDREREGRFVMVRLTARGTGLLDLYGDD